MPLAPGDRLGPYEIVAPLGAGGMGEVFQARDTRLNRTVAIKTSKAQFSERFEREARAIAALNHPNICTLYDVAPDYLVMEYVEGPSLADRIKQGPIPTGEALDLASQILDALAEAHAKGIAHRDLKPGNILLSKTGAKVLDFGLAKFQHAAGAGMNDATMTMPLTGEGSLLGTLQYMAPEQLEAKPADHRSDLFAFGLILYEMLTGKRAFEGASQASLIAAILKEQPRAVSELQPLTPKSLDRVVAACLEKDPDKRWQSARDIKRALEWARDGSWAPAAGSQTGAVAVSPKSSRLPWTVAGVLSVALAATAAWALWHTPTNEAYAGPTTRLAVVPPGQSRGLGNNQGSAISPDGRTLAFVARPAQDSRVMLFIRPLDAIEARAVPGSEGAQRPFWSPDSKSVAWFNQNQLMRVDLAGGGAQRICATLGAGRGGTWNANGVILFADQMAVTHGIRRVSASGGEPTDETVLDPRRLETSHYYPQFLPDGQHFLYLRRGPNEKTTGIYVGSLGDPKKGMEDKLLQASAFRGVYAAGYLLTVRGESLMAQPFDAAARTLSGEPKAVASGVTLVEANNFFDASASASGIIAYGTASIGVEEGVMRWYDRSGKLLSTAGPSITSSQVALSPDGKKVAGTLLGARAGIWTLDLDRDTRTRLTFQAPSNNLAWSADGQEIAFLSGGSPTHRQITVKPVNGGGRERIVPGADSFSVANLMDWTRDGRFVVGGGGGAAQDIFAVSPGGGKPEALVSGPGFQGDARISPDGRWIAYVSDESGVREVFIAGIGGVSGKWQVSTNGGANPHWRIDGRELIYRDVISQKMIAVPIAPGSSGLTLGKPVELFRRFGLFTLAATADHQRFLFVEPPEDEQSAPFIILQNWQQLVK